MKGMTPWQLTGLIAHVCLGIVAATLIWRAVPQMRKNQRERGLIRHVLLIKLTVVAVLAAAVTEIHFIATEVWHVAVAVVLTAVGLWAIRRWYRRLVAPSRHAATWLQTLGQAPRRRLGDGSHRIEDVPPRR